MTTIYQLLENVNKLKFVYLLVIQLTTAAYCPVRKGVFRTSISITRHFYSAAYTYSDQ